MFRTRFDKNPTIGVKFPIPSLTQQSEKDSTDINLIVKRYCECGICPSCEIRQPLSEDMLSIQSDTFQDVMQRQAQLTNAFNELPAHVRKKFDYNPLNMLEFVENPNNKEECVKLGLLKSDVLGSIIADVPSVSVTGSDIMVEPQSVQIPKEPVQVTQPAE